ncbi:MAG: tRNA preQ1(34) S-adenosylmethionine ribosyltransferase-isomerase QueA [Chloroflexi bacterium]|nr:tRNA preQ1(34) S-adenosylmethionine ribosyltransferase-isomerase QueA [Chloroflexota bacterium]
MRLEDLDYGLPPHYIAQQPCEPRDAARLLVYRRATGEFQHSQVAQLRDFLHPGDLLVANDTRVIPARLIGKREHSGGKVEVLLLRPQEQDWWEALVRPSQRLKPGARIVLESEEGKSRDVVEVGERLPHGKRLVRFQDDPSAVIERRGTTPLPPYIREPLADPARYQTTYARVRGSAAAPTAGLHFTPRLVQELEAHGVRFAFITLHIGLDTFQPIREADPLQHPIHSEYLEVPAETAQLIQETKARQGRVIAVGTTSVRALESAAAAQGVMQPFSGETRLYIYPGYRFRVVDGILTNFHLPRSTLLLLVAAYSGLDELKRIYRVAIEENYRFYSVGDASVLL